MTLNVNEERIGDRVRRRREALGMVQAHVADLAGMSRATLCRIEKGERALTSIEKIRNLARVLRCPVEHLTGVAMPGPVTHGDSWATVQALQCADLDFDTRWTGEPIPVAALAARVDDAVALRRGCEYAALTRQLPFLIGDLHAAASDPATRRDVLPLIVRVAESASFVVRYTGNPSGTAIAAERAQQAATASEDPVMLGFAGWTRAHAALAAGLHDYASQLAARAATSLAPHVDLAAAPEVLGMLHLTTAFSLVGAGHANEAEPYLAEASALAERTGETTTLNLMFGPTNVKLWELAILVDGSDPAQGIAIAQDIRPHNIPSASRQATFYLDLGRAHAAVGNVEQAVQAIEVSERLAPERVHGDPITVATVQGMLDAARRRAAGLRLRGLAERVGAAV
jgi:transcriptional regulator with XRE-family HTH domain